MKVLDGRSAATCKNCMGTSPTSPTQLGGLTMRNDIIRSTCINKCIHMWDRSTISVHRSEGQRQLACGYHEILSE